MSRLILWGWLFLFGFEAIGQVKARVERVIDADTYVLRMEGKSVTCRLANIDAPELKQDFGWQAQQFAEGELYFNELTVTVQSVDRYGRSIVSISTPNGELDSLLVVKGYAWHYAQYSNRPYLQQLMEQAVSNGVGLWACGKENVCPPWVYRGYNKRNRYAYCRGCGN